MKRIAPIRFINIGDMTIAKNRTMYLDHYPEHHRASCPFHSNLTRANISFWRLILVCISALAIISSLFSDSQKKE